MTKNNIIVPDLPESITDATVIKWYKKEGDTVIYEENLVDIETDKVMLEISSPCDGILSNIIEKESNIVQSQQILGQIIKSESHQEITSNNFSSKKIFSTPEKDNIKDDANDLFKFFSPSIRRLIKIYQSNPDIIKSSKNSNIILRKIIIDYIDKKNKNKILDKTHNIFFNKNDIDKNDIDKNDIDKNDIDKNDIDKNDIDKNDIDKNDIDKNDIDIKKRVKMTRLRQRIAERLLQTKNNTAMLTTFNEVNMEPIILLRKKYNKNFEQTYGIRIGFMSFYVKAVVEALKKFPAINASIDKDDIIYYKNFDISIAISTPRGLITPVLRNADTMSMSDIEKKIKEFSLKGIQNKITIQELIGGNFTITNGGVFGSLMSTPIINPPQTAILGIHLIKDRPMAIDGKIKILPMMYLALSYDHRLIDGKESVSFLLTIKNILEDFTSILIHT
ncbi:dihydrolipoyllysine-residue succinyltransferase [Buchnera aphidicola]|uniref:dihydrolipoyllysine-residue succinyltransferase n=1 Tax=Buchnera aphidicola TaxID=9 RepID=UPI003464E667